VKPVLSTQDLSLVESARLTLEGEGIATITTTDTSASAHGPTILSILNDEEFEHARSVLRALSLSGGDYQVLARLRWPLRFAILVLLTWFLFYELGR